MLAEIVLTGIPCLFPYIQHCNLPSSYYLGTSLFTVNVVPTYSSVDLIGVVELQTRNIVASFMQEQAYFY